MKNVRIEIHVTAFVHIGEGVTEGLPPYGVPVHREDFEMKRVVSLSDSATLTESANQHATVKAQAVSMLAGMAGVLPEKLAHGSRYLGTDEN